MEIYYQICNRISSGTIFESPSGRSEFKWIHSDPLRVMLEVGPKKTIITIPSHCFQELADFLKGREWVEIRAIHGTPRLGSVDELLQKCAGRSVASYVIPIFKRAGFVEVSRKKPMRVRWKID